MRRGLTLVEVLAALLVLSMGMLSAIAVARHGVNIAREAVASNLAGATAATVICNARQAEMGSAGVVDWQAAGSTWTGYVNGLYVRRTISDAVDPSNPADPGRDQRLRFRTVTVDVYWSAEAEDFCRFRERMVFCDR